MSCRRLAYFLAAWMLSLSSLAHADWPTSPITLVVGFPETSASYNVARLLRPAMERRLRTPISLDYRVGAEGSKAWARVAAARPDGYTILLAPTAALNSSWANAHKLVALLDDVSNTGAGHSAPLWFGLFAPRGLDPEIAQRVKMAAQAALELPHIRDSITPLGTAHREESIGRAGTIPEAGRMQRHEPAKAAVAPRTLPGPAARRPAARSAPPLN